VAVESSIVTESRRLSVAIETGGVWFGGQTVVHLLGVTGRIPNVEVVIEASHERFLEMLHGAVAAR
jgi:inosine-uridine nucleoside N-ribohydrolase